MDKKIIKIKIKRNNFDVKNIDNQIKFSDSPLPQSYFVWLICGMKGTGKSTVILNVLNNKKSPYYKFFDNIYFVSSTGKRDHKFDKLIDELEEDNKYYSECNDENLNEIITKIQEYNDDSDDKDIHNLLILDDCVHNLPSSTQRDSALNRIITQCRHLKLSVIITSQQFLKINPLIRNNTDMISFFKTYKVKEYEALENMLNISKEKLKIYYDFATKDGNNNFLHISLFGGKEPLFFRKFDKIELIE